MAGAQPQITKLYPAISYPVGRGTPMLNSKVGWDHSSHFPTPKIYANCKIYINFSFFFIIYLKHFILLKLQSTKWRNNGGYKFGQRRRCLYSWS